MGGGVFFVFCCFCGGGVFVWLFGLLFFLGVGWLVEGVWRWFAIPSYFLPSNPERVATHCTPSFPLPNLPSSSKRNKTGGGGRSSPLPAKLSIPTATCSGTLFGQTSTNIPLPILSRVKVHPCRRVIGNERCRNQPI